jgi:hypothetical protein
MEPGIQLMLRMEREAQAQRRQYKSYRDDLEDEKTVRLERDNLVKRIFNPRRQQQCECV